MQLRIAVLCVGLCIASVLAAPADPEYKPVLAPAPDANADADPYTLLSSPWSEPKPVMPKPNIPQTGSLISLEAAVTQADELVPKNTSQVVVSAVPHGELSPLPQNITADPKAANPIQDHYPVSREDPKVAAYKSSEETVAPPPVIDLTKKDVFGVQPPPVMFNRPEDPHPMEVMTPIPDNAPCDPDRVLNVTVRSAVYEQGSNVPYLPLRFGCSSAFDISREKLSPEVFWTNVSEDVVDFSLQMIDMGDNCAAKGDQYGRIHWHVTGIKGAPSVTLKEGASHDKRMLFGGIEQPNQWLEEYYAGPCPVPSVTGCYRIKVLAHRANGRCQCGYQDFLFARPAKPQVESLIIGTTKSN